MIAELAIETGIAPVELLRTPQSLLNEMLEVLDQRARAAEHDRKVAEMKARLPK